MILLLFGKAADYFRLPSAIRTNTNCTESDRNRRGQLGGWSDRLTPEPDDGHDAGRDKQSAVLTLLVHTGACRQ